MSVIFVDTETTGLDPQRHEVWDIALIEEDGTEHEWHIKPQSFRSADEGALRITHFYERIAAAGYREETIEESYPKRTTKVRRANFWTPQSRSSIAREVATLTAGKHLVGAVPSFDARFLAGFLMREDHVPAWHYHLVCCENLAAGKLGMKPPWNSYELTEALRVSLAVPPVESVAIPIFGEKHTAIADARWAKWMYEAVFKEN